MKIVLPPHRTFLMGLVALSMSGCADLTTNTMVFGERTGINIGVTVDPAKSTPIELNTGFRRQVIGVTPPSKVDANGNAVGEAANMASNFDLAQAVDESGNPLTGGSVSMRGSFMSGKAATTFFARSDENTVNAVTNKLAAKQVVAVEGSANTAEIAVEDTLVALINANPSENAPRYLTLAKSKGLTVAPHGSPQISAILTAKDARNAAGNKEILKELSDS
ncbi:hypothetical protein NBRC116594_37680 [Shimia sp. NS0008-38b]|uniref:hypothetical protein n=1 Tax=Shimia sp. NS0008-38b TaxID=3127653 RepID=UPI0031071AC2